MSRILVLGGGVSGHTAASYLRKWLGKDHTVTVVTPNSLWNWIPSNIWVGVGKMTKKDVVFDLAHVYNRHGIEYLQAKALSIHPDGGTDESSPYVEIEYTSTEKAGAKEKVTYDYIINATGPKLNFNATEGLGPDDGYSVSVCTADHATHAAKKLMGLVEEMKNGAKKQFVIGTGHGTCTCQGAAFEYIFNVDFILREHGVREQAEIIWLTNEYELGDLGMGGAHIRRNGYITSTKTFTESLMAERGIHWIKRAHVYKLDEKKIYFENLRGERDEVEYDFTMLIPPFSGVGLKAFSKSGDDITSTIFAGNGFMKVDADYSGKPYEEWEAEDWPRSYQNPTYSNMFACGIAFAPPHAMSKPMKNPNGIPINPTPPRTGMPSATIGRLVAKSIVNTIKTGNTEPIGLKSMAEMGAACVASTGMGALRGTAAAMTVFPIVQDYKRYPRYGRSLSLTFGEIGLAGHWIKHILHWLFLYKAKLKFGWSKIPE